MGDNIDTLPVTTMQITELHPCDYNPRKISDEQYEALKKSMGEYGFVEPILIDLTDNNSIIGGHQRFNVLLDEILDENREDKIYVIRLGSIGWAFTDLDLSVKDKPHQMGLNLALNKISGDWDNLKLKDMFEELSLVGFDIDLTGFEDVELKELDLSLDKNNLIESKEDNYVEPENLDTEIQHGDIFRLGDHVLVCGDCTCEDDLKKLLTLNGGGVVLIDTLITDPPYGVDYGGKNEFLNSIDNGNRVQKDIENDNINDYRNFFSEVLNNVIPYFNDYNTFYIFMSSLELHNLRLAIQDTNCKWGDYLVWVKNNHVLGRKDYNSKHEFCTYGWYGKHKFYGDFSTTVLCFDKPLKNDLHPTMKPIPLISKLICDGTKENMNVLDVFGGSGSTLIACEQTNRNCYMMELDPHYCQVIIDRWETLTGETATKLE